MVLNIGAGWDHNRGRLVWLRFPFVLTEPLISCNGGTTRIIVVVLPLTIELSEDSILSDSNVWCKEDYKVTSSGDVPCKGTKTDLSCEGDASESSKVEGTFGHAAKTLIQAIAVVIDLIRANTAGK